MPEPPSDTLTILPERRYLTREEIAEWARSGSDLRPNASQKNTSEASEAAVSEIK